MSTLALLPRDRPFDYLLLNDRLSSYAAPRDRITRLLKSGEIIRVKKGLYIPGGLLAIKEVDPLALSGLVFGPSYVSGLKALEIHGMILERVEEITCATTKRPKLFETPVGRFSYFVVPKPVFGLGVELVNTDGGSYFLATPEKALCDQIAQASQLTRLSEMTDYLLADLRVDEDALSRLSAQAIQEIASLYRKTSVQLLSRWIDNQTTSSS